MDYPLTSRKNVLIRPGHLVSNQLFIFVMLIKSCPIHIKNEVSLEAVKVTPKRNIEAMSPTKRNCYFDHENPPSQPLTVHQKYSQVRNEYKLFEKSALILPTF